MFFSKTVFVCLRLFLNSAPSLIIFQVNSLSIKKLVPLGFLQSEWAVMKATIYIFIPFLWERLPNFPMDPKGNTIRVSFSISDYPIILIAVLQQVLMYPNSELLWIQPSARPTPADNLKLCFWWGKSEYFDCLLWTCSLLFRLIPHRVTNYTHMLTKGFKLLGLLKSQILNRPRRTI